MKKLTMLLAPVLPSFDSIPKTMQPITRPHAATHHVYMYNLIMNAAVNILYFIISFKFNNPNSMIHHTPTELIPSHSPVPSFSDDGHLPSLLIYLMSKRTPHQVAERPFICQRHENLPHRSIDPKSQCERDTLMERRYGHMHHPISTTGIQ